MEEDVVFGMQVASKSAAAGSEYPGKTYSFCSPGCKRKFHHNPDQYANKSSRAPLCPVCSGAPERLT